MPHGLAGVAERPSLSFTLQLPCCFPGLFPPSFCSGWFLLPLAASFPPSLALLSHGTAPLVWQGGSLWPRELPVLWSWAGEHKRSEQGHILLPQHLDFPPRFTPNEHFPSISLSPQWLTAWLGLLEVCGAPTGRVHPWAGCRVHPVSSPWCLCRQVADGTTRSPAGVTDVLALAGLSLAAAAARGCSELPARCFSALRPPGLWVGGGDSPDAAPAAFPRVRCHPRLAEVVPIPSLLSVAGRDFPSSGSGAAWDLPLTQTRRRVAGR